MEPRVTFDGPIDTAVDAETGTELLATLRESLSNIARHAQASHAEVEIEVGAEVVLRVRDDGVGPPGPGARRGRGLDNMAARATRLGGTMTLEPGGTGGTELEWRVPKR
jgi:signal transduction histidine kinase